MADTPQQARILRASRTARKVRRRFGAGTRVVVVPGAGAEPRPGAMTGTVLRHVPGLNAQGGTLTIQWDDDRVTRGFSPCGVRPVAS
jgi:hypothetical protein